jgi:hypothetical protein
VNETVEDVAAGDLTLGCGIVTLFSNVGRNSMMVTKKVQDSQMDSK